MQKKLIALAIAGLSGAAFAQSNVTVYGQMNMAYMKLSSSTEAAATKNFTGIHNLDSRLGFKGEEALGGGLKAVFTQEFGVTADSNGGAAATSGLGASARQTFVGLSGGFGTVTLGRQYTPYFEAAAAIDPFGASTTNVASTATLHPIATIARANNSVKYVGVFDAAGGKVIVAGLYGFGEDTTTAGVPGATDTKITNWKLAYASGPLLVGITGIKFNDTGLTLTAAPGTGAGASLATAATAGDRIKGLALGGTYDLKSVKLHLLHDRVKVDDVGLGGNNAVDRKINMIAASVPMGAHTFKVAYNKLSESGSALGSTADSKHTGLGYAYAMSKRTNMIANYGNVSTNSANTSSLMTGGLGGGYKSGFQLGMTHSF